MSELPKGWVETRLGELGDWSSGGTPSRGHPEYYKGDIPWVKTGDLEDDILLDTPEKISEAALKNSSAKLFPAGTLLVAMYGATIGKTALLGVSASTNQACAAFLPSGTSKELIPFLWKFVLGHKTDFIAAGQGGAQPNISQTLIKEFGIKLPPLAEQKRIVAKLDALNAKSARARTELARIETLVSRYKQAVLSKAFNGELTADWRQGNSATWPWRSETWKDCGETLNGRAFPSGDYRSSGVKLLRPGNLGPEGDVFWSEKNTRYLPPKYAAEFPKHFIRGEAVLINLTAQSLEDQFLGRACLSLPSDNFMLNQRIGLFRPINMTNKFCLFSLKSADFRSFVDNGMNSGSLIQHVHTKQLEQYRFVIPDIEEQHEIVRRIESAFARIDRLAAEAKRALDLVGKLDEAILAKAFAGELVPQDPADEPAEKLLERIRAERDAAPKVRRGRGRKA